MNTLIRVYNQSDVGEVAAMLSGIDFDYTPNSNRIPGRPYHGTFRVSRDFHSDVVNALAKRKLQCTLVNQ